MFCTSLRRRQELSPLIPLLSSSTSPKLRETKLSTHDLALPLFSSLRGSQYDNTESGQVMLHQLFLILTPECILVEKEEEEEGEKKQKQTEEGEDDGEKEKVVVVGKMKKKKKKEEGLVKVRKDTMERIERFSMLVERPVGVVVFLMGGKDEGGGADVGGGGDGSGVREYLMFLNCIHSSTTPLPSSPPPILPIPSPSSFLSILSTYTTSLLLPSPILLPPPPPWYPSHHNNNNNNRIKAIHLLAHATTKLTMENPKKISEHAVYVLTDLFVDIKNVAAEAVAELEAEAVEAVEGKEKKKGFLENWIGEEEAIGVKEFWGGEWVYRDLGS